MKTTHMKFKGQEIEVVTHYIDGEISEVYIYWRGEEIIFGYDLEDAQEKLEAFFSRGEQ